MAVDSAGNLYIADNGNLRVRKVNTAAVISTVAGNGKCCLGGDDVPATAAQVAPAGLAVDAAGNLYIGASGYVRKILTSDTITTIGRLFSPGDDAGISAAVPFGSADALAVDAAGNVYVADSGRQRVHKLTPQPWRRCHR